MVKEQIVIIFNENEKRYGYRRITKELHNNDICVNHKTVRKLMKQLGLVCQVRAKRKYSSYKGEVGEVAPNLLERHFKTNQPNRKWVTDVTEFKVNDQKLYLSPILDLFNGEVVSYNLSRHPNFKQITDMLEGAFQKLPDKVDNLILHSDQGCLPCPTAKACSLCWLAPSTVSLAAWPLPCRVSSTSRTRLLPEFRFSRLSAPAQRSLNTNRAA